MDQGEDRERVTELVAGILRGRIDTELLGTKVEIPLDISGARGGALVFEREVPGEHVFRLAALRPPGYWTDKPPTDPGFYWVRVTDSRRRHMPAHVLDFSGGLWTSTEGLVEAFARDAGWLFWSERLEPPAEG